MNDPDPEKTRQTLGLKRAEMLSVTGVHSMTWQKWAKKERKPPKIAYQYFRLLIWLATHYPAAMNHWKREVEKDVYKTK